MGISGYKINKIFEKGYIMVIFLNFTSKNHRKLLKRVASGQNIC